jgi:hypothetical protein
MPAASSTTVGTDSLNAIENCSRRTASARERERGGRTMAYRGSGVPSGGQGRPGDAVELTVFTVGVLATGVAAAVGVGRLLTLLAGGG